MVNPLTEAIVAMVNARLGLVLDAAAVGIPTDHQFQALRKIVLGAFGDHSFLPELEAVVQKHGKARNEQAQTAGKGVP